MLDLFWWREDLLFFLEYNGRILHGVRVLNGHMALSANLAAEPFSFMEGICGVKAGLIRAAPVLFMYSSSSSSYIYVYIAFVPNLSASSFSFTQRGWGKRAIFFESPDAFMPKILLSLSLNYDGKASYQSELRDSLSIEERWRERKRTFDSFFYFGGKPVKEDWNPADLPIMRSREEGGGFVLYSTTTRKKKKLSSRCNKKYRNWLYNLRKKGGKVTGGGKLSRRWTTPFKVFFYEAVHALFCNPTSLQVGKMLI